MRHIEDSIAAHVAQSGGKMKAHHVGLLRAIAARVPDPWADQPSVRISRAKLAALTGYTSEDTIKQYLGELVNLGCIRKSKDHNNEGTLITLLRPTTHDGIEPHPAEPTPDSVIAALAVKWLRDGETEPMPLTADELQAVRVFDLIRRSGMLIRPKKGPKKQRQKAAKDEWSDIALAISDAVGIPRTKSDGPKKKYWRNNRPESWVALAKTWKDANGEAAFCRVLAAAKVWDWGDKKPYKRAHMFEDPKLIAELLSAAEAAPAIDATPSTATGAEKPTDFVPTEEDHRIRALLRESLGLTEADALATAERIATAFGLYEHEVADALARFKSNSSDRPKWLTD